MQDKKGSVLLCEFGMNVICLVCSTLILLADNVRWVNRIALMMCVQLTMSSSIKHERNVFLISATNYFFFFFLFLFLKLGCTMIFVLRTMFTDLICVFYIIWVTWMCLQEPTFIKFPINHKELHRSEKKKLHRNELIKNTKKNCVEVGKKKSRDCDLMIKVIVLVLRKK